MKQLIFILNFFTIFIFSQEVSLGVDEFFSQEKWKDLKDKKIALAINHTSVNKNLVSTLSLFQKNVKNAKIIALFSPEHGIDGRGYANEKIDHSMIDNIPIYSLHGKHRRPTEEMLKNIDCIIYDIQCTGNRAYTYPSMLFYLMEEASKKNIQIIVLDRPNPINGITIDGPMLEEKWRSYIGYINVPYCHGMTIGELAQFFNDEYKVGCNLKVIPMKGWKRSMNFRDTGLNWVPPSPHIPESDTPIFSLMTGILGELQIVNIGIGYTMPFKMVGAPWIQAQAFAEKLNSQKLPGVHFQPFYFRPFYGAFKGVDCEGVLIQITDAKKLKPLSVQYLILGILKSMYPQEFDKKIALSKSSKDLFCKANGTAEIYNILVEEKYPAWKLIDFQKAERETFSEKRKKYLLEYPP